MNILVIGSANTDMVVKTPRFPRPGETLLGGTFFMNQGGKGANQAVSATRLGGKVQFICKVGDDIFGQNALVSYRKERIDTQFALMDSHHPSGIAVITVDEHGENSIVVAPGANHQLMPSDLESSQKAIEDASIVLMQLEIPLLTVDHVCNMAKGKVILNPAPAQPLPESLLQHVHVLTPNESEAEILTGIVVHDKISAREAAAILRKKGVDIVIITLGSQGAYVQTDLEEAMISAPVVSPQDTTAAGDVFNGALAVALAEKMELKEAVAWACRAASISVTRLGAQDSAPFRYELES